MSALRNSGMSMRPPPEPDIVSLEPPNPHAPPFSKSYSSPDPTLEPGRDVVSPLPPQQPDGPLRVLVVDDDPMTRMLMSRMLTRLGAEVMTACDGQQALDLLLGYSASTSNTAAATSSRAASPVSAVAPDNPAPEQQPQYFDLISLDNAMPVMTGQQAVRKLRSLGRTDFVVGATGNALKSDQKAYLEAGADQVLSKPVMLKDIKAVLQIALERRNSAHKQTATTVATPPPLTTTYPFVQTPYFPLLPRDLEP